MTPILDQQKRLAQTGRIRIGSKVEFIKDGEKKTRPAKLETFRFTSSNQKAIEAVAEKYGGSVAPWDENPGQWELFTTSSVIGVLIPPSSMSLMQFYELWSGGGCQRRCDGFTQVPSDEACVCDPDDRECKPHTRLSLMLADLPGSGMWRLDTQGWYAMNEIGAAFDLAGMIAQATGRSIIPGTLRLDGRTVKRPGQRTKNFVVPVLDFDVNMSALARGELVSIESRSGVTPIQDDEKPMTLAEELEAVNTPVEKPKRSNAAEPIRPTGVRPRARGTVHEDDEPTDRVDDTKAPTKKQVEELDALWSMLAEEDMPDVRQLWVAKKIPPKARLDTVWIERAIELVKSVLNAVSEPVDAPKVETIKADDIQPPRPTQAKMRRMFALLHDAGVEGDEAQHSYVWRIIGRNAESFTNLTRPDINKVIDQLEEDIKSKGGEVYASSAPSGDLWDEDRL
jgi:hypothetical protein